MRRRLGWWLLVALLAAVSRLSRVHRASFDLAFLKVMADRHEEGLRMARFEARDGGLPEVRALARQMLTELEAQLRQMTAWQRAWAKTGTGAGAG